MLESPPKANATPHDTLMMFAWCAGCGRQGRMLTPAQAAALCSVSTRTIYRWAATGKIHQTHTPAGALLVCYSSLFC